MRYVVYDVGLRISPDCLLFIKVALYSKSAFTGLTRRTSTLTSRLEPKFSA